MALAKADFFVSTDGNDAWSGTLPEPNETNTDGPFATLEQARDAIRQLKAAEGLNAPVTVMVRGGTYYLAEPLLLGPHDSGTAAFPVTYTAYPDEQAVLSGGRPVMAWQPYRGQIRQCDLKALGLGELRFKQLFYKGVRQPLARFPNLDPREPRTGGFLYLPEDVGEDQERSKQLLKYDPAKLDPSGWAHPELAEVNVFPYHNWTNDIIPIAEIDLDNYVIRLASDASYELINDTRFYVQNVFEELDAPGEWYLDSETRTLYFWPPDDEFCPDEVVMPVLDGLIKLKGDAAKDAYVIHLHIDGFVLRECRGTAVCLEAAQHCTIARSTITNTGGDGVALDSACADNRVVGNDIAYVGATGIEVAGEHNVISNNHIHDTGAINKSFNNAVLIRGTAHEISHNLIHHVPAFGISFHDYDHIIEYNYIHHFGLETNLAGAIYAYSLKDPAAVGGVIIRFNKMSDAVGYGMASPGEFGPDPGWGIWLDDMISNTTIHGNILVRNLRGGVVLHGGNDNIITNNIMGAGVPSTINHIRPDDEPCNNIITKNIIYYPNADPLLLRQYGWTVKGITESASNAAAVPVFLCGWSSGKAAVAESDCNLLFPIRGENVDALFYFRGGAEHYRGPWADEPVEDRFAWWREQGYEAHSIIADPLFVDAAHDDYTLPPESPALELGFEPIPVERIGLYASEERATWPVEDQGSI